MINKYRIINLFIVLFFVSFNLKSAYSSEEDSLKACLHSAKNNLERIKIINILCEKAWLKANYSEALNYVERAFELEKTELLKSSSNRDVLIEQAYTFNNIAIIYRYKGDYSV
ncbi:MAG: hypothetical protein IPJ32_17300 [Sphingobacteriaceae bacterium]|nr:hypothetical protein [Sphingobacteriaceae bacterium]